MPNTCPLPKVPIRRKTEEDEDQIVRVMEDDGDRQMCFVQVHRQQNGISSQLEREILYGKETKIMI